MGQVRPHTKLINRAAQRELKPLGLQRKGRSRVWLDDQGWWIGVVEFQPSSWSRGTYLNVGVGWLWAGLGLPLPADGGNREIGWSFGFDKPFGSRVLLKDGDQFASYESDEQFAPVAAEIARLAAERVRYQRAHLRTPEEAAQALRDGYDMSDGLDTAVAMALAGHRREALTILARCERKARARLDSDRRVASDARHLEQVERVRSLIAGDELADTARDHTLSFRRLLQLPDDVRLPF